MSPTLEQIRCYNELQDYGCMYFDRQRGGKLILLTEDGKLVVVERSGKWRLIH